MHTKVKYTSMLHFYYIVTKIKRYKIANTTVPHELSYVTNYKIKKHIPTAEVNLHLPL